MPSARAQVFAVLDQTVHSIRNIDQPALRAMMPVLMKAQAEVQHALRLWLARDGLSVVTEAGLAELIKQE